MARKAKVAVEVVAPVVVEVADGLYVSPAVAELIPAELVEEVVVPVELVEEVVVPVELVEEVVVPVELAPSEFLALLMAPVAGEVVAKQATSKNQGVGKMIRELITDGLSNTAILKKVHDEYGNKNTTYACVAWYRNKMKKTAQVVSTTKAVEVVEKFLAEENDESELETADELRQMVGL